MRAAPVLALALGCGRVSFDEVPSSPPAPDADAACWASWRADVALEPPLLRDDVASTFNDKNPFLTRDGSSLYFASDRPGGLGGIDFWHARRQPEETRFKIAGPVTELSGSGFEGRLELDASELVAVFSAIRPEGKGANDIYIATRADRESPFVIDPSLTAAINNTTDEKDPHFLDGSAQRLYYNVGSLGFRVAMRAGAGPFGAGVPVEVTGATGLSDPQPSPDERTLVFSATGPAGDFDFYVATRESTSEPFTNARSLAVLNSPLLERDISVTADGCEVWFSTARNGRDEIWMSRVIR